MKSRLPAVNPVLPNREGRPPSPESKASRSVRRGATGDVHFHPGYSKGENFTLAFMSARQRLLFPDAQPLVERLGREFFRSLPDRPGVYLMKNDQNAPLYVGKAKNLRKRLGSYRVANPDRLPSRQLRMLRQVRSIEIEICTDESESLKRESYLIRSLRPRFNRAGTWQGPERYFGWRWNDASFQCIVTLASNADGWNLIGPLGRLAAVLRVVLIRLLWSACHPEKGIFDMPAGWVHGRLSSLASFPVEKGFKEESMQRVQLLFSGNMEPFVDWIRQCRASHDHILSVAILESDLETLQEIVLTKRRRNS